MDLGLRRHVAGVRRAGARRATGRRRRPRVHRLRRRHRHPERRPHARARRRARSSSRPRSTCTSATPSRSTSRTSRSSSAICQIHPGAGPYKGLLVNSGAEAVENAVKIARYATGRQAIVAFDQAFHGRTLLAMTLTSKAMPYKKGFGPFAPEVYRAPGPYPYRGISGDDAIAGVKKLFKSQIDPSAVAAVIYEPVQGEGGFLPGARGLPAGAQGPVRGARHPLHRRRGAGRHVPHRARGVHRALRRRARPVRVGQVDGRRHADRRRDRPRRPHGRRARRRPRRHVRRQPDLLRRRHRVARRGARPGLPGARPRARRPTCARGSTTSPPASRPSATCAASARCSRSSWSRTASPRRRPPPWPAAPSSWPASAACC